MKRLLAEGCVKRTGALTPEERAVDPNRVQDTRNEVGMPRLGTTATETTIAV